MAGFVAALFGKVAQTVLTTGGILSLPFIADAAVEHGTGKESKIGDVTMTGLGKAWDYAFVGSDEAETAPQSVREGAQEKAPGSTAPFASAAAGNSADKLNALDGSVDQKGSWMDVATWLLPAVTGGGSMLLGGGVSTGATIAALTFLSSFIVPEFFTSLKDPGKLWNQASEYSPLKPSAGDAMNTLLYGAPEPAGSG